MLAIAARAASLVLAVTFGWAALAKVFRPDRWRDALERYHLGRPLEQLALIGVPVAEAAACALLASGAPRGGGALSLALASAFSLAIVRARSQEGEALPCGCFGGSRTQDHRLMLVRNALIGVAAGFVVAAGTEGSSAPAVADYLPAALVTVGVICGVWLVTEMRASLRR